MNLQIAQNMILVLVKAGIEFREISAALNNVETSFNEYLTKKDKKDE